MLVLNLLALENKKYSAYERFHGKGPYDEIPTKKEPIRTLGFHCHIINRGYYIPARKYEFYLRAFNSIIARVEHEKIQFIYTSGNVIFCL